MAMSRSVIDASNATLYKPVGTAEDVERAKAERTLLRLALGRHACPALPACPEHGRQVCDCNPCLHPDHAADRAGADDARKAVGLLDDPRATHRTCDVCGKTKAQSQFGSTHHDTCKGCQVEAKRAGADHA
jgi:hypothetical protein